MTDYKKIFFGVMAGVAGYLVVYLVLGLYSVTLFSIGYYLIMKYNKKNTKVFKDMNIIQYVGIMCWILSMLPYSQFFFMGFMRQAGVSLMDRMFLN